MGDYAIYIGKNCFTVSGTEAAFNAYTEAVKFAEAIGEDAELVSIYTGEVIAATDMGYDIRSTYKENE